MNRPFQYLIIGSIAALLCAIVGALWLVWHSLQESRTLERQNRELQASLEASRIRVENFCEYPADVLCKVDARTDSVAGVMDVASLEPLMEKDASLAVKHQKAVASVQALLAAAADAPQASPADKAAPADKPAAKQAEKPAAAKASAPLAKQDAPAPTKTAPASTSAAPDIKKDRKAAAQKEEIKKTKPQDTKKEGPKDEKPASPLPVKSETKAESKAETASAPVQKKEAPASSAKPVAPVEAKTENPGPAKPVAAAPSTPAVKAPVSVPAESPVPALPAVPVKAEPAPAQAESPVVPIAEGRLEISGKLVLLPDEPEHDNAPATKPAPKAEKKDSPKSVDRKAVPESKTAPAVKAVPAAPKAKAASPAEMRKSWSKVEHDGDNFGFTITGAGDSLPASGQLLPKPWRYELTLNGSWAVQTHSKVENRLVKNMRVVQRGADTVIVFQLKQKPYRCSLHRPDKRTVTVRIR